jgi:hypothetical protein
MVEHCQAAGNVRRVMLLHAYRSRPQPDSLGVRKRAGDKELGHRDRLVLHRMMFADPELVEAEFFGPNDQFQVFVQALA